MFSGLHLFIDMTFVVLKKIEILFVKT